MPASDIARALEDHLITEAEALEQANVDTLQALHEKAAGETQRGRRQGEARSSMDGHRSLPARRTASI